MSSTLRFQIVGEAFKKRPVEVPRRTERPSEFFAKYVFNRRKMQQYLPADVYKKMLECYSDFNGNNSSMYKLGRDADAVLEEAREKVAKAINACTKEIYFTSCGSESDNLALKGRNTNEKRGFFRRAKDIFKRGFHEK